MTMALLEKVESEVGSWLAGAYLTCILEQVVEANYSCQCQKANAVEDRASSGFQ